MSFNSIRQVWGGGNLSLKTPQKIREEIPHLNNSELVWKNLAYTFQSANNYLLYWIIKYEQNIVKHNSVDDFIKVYFYIALSTICFGSSYEPSSGLLVFLSKVKYTISNAIIIVTYEISYNMYKNLK